MLEKNQNKNLARRKGRCDEIFQSEVFDKSLKSNILEVTAKVQLLTIDELNQVIAAAYSAF